MTKKPLKTPLEFILAGKAIFTLSNKLTNNRFTFRVRKAKQGQDAKKDAKNIKLPYFVSVLTQNENSSPTSYRYLGTIFPDNVYRHGKKSTVSPEASSSKAFGWLIRQLTSNTPLPANVEVCHCGYCGACGRLLTVPESIETGLGPKCRGQENKPTNPNAKRGKDFA